MANWKRRTYSSCDPQQFDPTSRQQPHRLFDSATSKWMTVGCKKPQAKHTSCRTILCHRVCPGNDSSQPYRDQAPVSSSLFGIKETRYLAMSSVQEAKPYHARIDD